MHFIVCALANERRKDLFAQAEQARRIDQARRNGTFSPPTTRRTRRWSRPDRYRQRPPTAEAAAGEAVLLHDGAHVTVRPIRSADAPRLADAFDRLSEASRHHRFLAAKKELSAAELRHLTVVDHHAHEAMIAIDVDGDAIGVARYVRSPQHPRRAEVAVTVIDEWHRRGLGRALLERLAERAGTTGVGTFTALIGTGNAAALALIRGFGGSVETVQRDADTALYAIDLTQVRAAVHDRRPDPRPAISS